MIERIILELGPWSWWVLGLVLLAAEVVAPGVFLVWIGIAAILTGVVSLLLWETGFWVWQVQFVVLRASCPSPPCSSGAACLPGPADDVGRTAAQPARRQPHRPNRRAGTADRRRPRPGAARRHDLDRRGPGPARRRPRPGRRQPAAAS